MFLHIFVLFLLPIYIYHITYHIKYAIYYSVIHGMHGNKIMVVIGLRSGPIRITNLPSELHMTCNDVHEIVINRIK